MKFTKNPKNLIYGRHPIQEALDAGQEFDRIFIQSANKSESLKAIRQQATEMGINIQSVPIEKLKRLTNANHQGVAGYLSLVQYYKVEDILSLAYEKGELPLFIILDSVQDVRNFGAIVRSAQCFNVHGIIISSVGGAPISGDAIKASAGALATFPICKVDDLGEAVNYLKENGLMIAVAALSKSDFIYKVPFDQPMAIIMGAEGKGVSSHLTRLADIEVNIPHSGNFDSLNVSVASGIILYEVTRQRKTSS